MAILATRPGPPASPSRGLDHERDLVRSSLTLLETGGASRVTVVGLRFAERILPEMRSAAGAQGIALRATPRRRRWDIVVEPIG